MPDLMSSLTEQHPALKIYLVGGAVRDVLLGLPVSERDWVVVGATRAQMLKQGFRQADADFPVFHHPETGEEYALARLERKTGAGYRGFAIDANPNVTLQQDLMRRDLTINAIAQDAQGHLIDPFHGQNDLQEGFLRHISPAFSEDPVRLLRVARFAAKLGRGGFRVAHKTHRLMKQMVVDGAIAELKPQRIWYEMKKSLGYQQPWRFFMVLNACGALVELLPALADALLANAHQPDKNSAALAALRQACQFSDQVTIRFAALFLTTDMPDWLAGVLEKRFARLLADTRKARTTLAGLQASDAQGIYHFLHQYRAWQPNGRFMQIMQVLQAQAEYTEWLEKIIRAQRACAGVDVEQLKAQGLGGPDLGRAITQRRIQAIQNSIAINW